MKKYFEMVNEEKRIATCSLVDFPEELVCKETGFDLEKLPFFYDREQDVIVFFPEVGNHEQGIAVAESYLDLPVEGKAEIMLTTDAALFHMFRMLSRIATHRAVQEGKRYKEGGVL